MRYEMITAITAVLKESEIDLKLSDIKELEDNGNKLVLHCLNHEEMFEFILTVIYKFDRIEITTTEVEDSPYSCDNSTVICMLPEELVRTNSRYKVGEKYWFKNSYAGPNRQSCGTFIDIDKYGNYRMFNEKYGYITVTKENLDSHNS